MLDLCFALFALIYIDKTFPITEAWGVNYSELMSSGLMPYRDFHYYSMPLNLFIDEVLWTLSAHRFLIYRLLRLCEGMLILDILFLMLSRKRYHIPIWITWVASLAGGILGSGTANELAGDYNQTTILLFVILGCLVVFYLEWREDIARRRRVRLCLVLAGIVTGLLVLIKQPAGLAAVVTFIIFFSALTIKSKDLTYIKSLVFVAGISLIPITVCLIWLAANQALPQFVQQVILGGSKGSSESVIFGSLLNFVAMRPGLFALALVCSASAYLLNSCAKGKKVVLCAAIWMVCVVSLWMYALYPEDAASTLHFFIESKAAMGILLLTIGPIALYGVLKYRNNKFANGNYFALLYVPYLFIVYDVCWYLLSNNAFGIAYLLYRDTGSFNFLLPLTQILTALVFLRVVKSFINGGLKEPINGLYVAAIASSYSTLMGRASDGSVDPHALFFLAPVFLAPLLTRAQWMRRASESVFMALMTALFLICGAQKATSSYSWWGWSEAPVWESRYESSIPSLSGFKLTESENNIYTEITKIIDTNGNANSTILGFPHMVVFNVLTNRTEYPWFVPVLFYDVCSDQYAEIAAKEIAENPPDFVIWCDMPGCMQIHEQLFRDGNQLGQRKIQEWFSTASNSEYTLVGQTGNLFVYQLSSQITPATYTYIEDLSVKNQTAVKGSA